jgi:hypothetical protein
LVASRWNKDAGNSRYDWKTLEKSRWKNFARQTDLLAVKLQIPALLDFNAGI